MKTGRVRRFCRVSATAMLAAVLVVMPAAVTHAMYTGDTQPWQTNGNTLPAVVGAATSVTNNGYVYEIGGYTRSSVYYAQLNTNGTTGAWTATATLPVNIEHATSVAYNGYIYEIGGDDSVGGTYGNVYYAKANSDGTLGSWIATTGLPVGRDRAASIVSNGYVYVLGGGPSNSAYYAPLNANGTVGSWAATSNLPASLEGLTAATYNGRVYILGGFGSGFSNAVYYASLNVDGTISNWAAGTSVPTGLEFATALAANGFLYFVGGYNGTASTAVSYVSIASNGSLGTWQTSSNALPAGRYAATSVVNDKYIYEIGGSDGSMVDTVYYAQLAGFTMVPAVTLPVAATSYSTVPVAFTLPESPLPGSLRLIFTGPATAVVTLSTTPDVGPYSFSLNPKDILSDVTDVMSTTSNTLPDGTYAVTLSYQDLASDPAATSTTLNVTIDTALTSTPQTNTTPIGTLTTGGNGSGTTSTGALADTGLELAGIQAMAAGLVILAVVVWRFRRQPAKHEPKVAASGAKETPGIAQ